MRIRHGLPALALGLLAARASAEVPATICWTFPDRQTIIYTDSFQVSFDDMEKVQQAWIAARHEFAPDIPPTAQCGGPQMFARSRADHRAVHSDWRPAGM